MVNTIYLFSFVETPRKFIIAELSIRKLGSSLNYYFNEDDEEVIIIDLLCIISTDMTTSLKIPVKKAIVGREGLVSYRVSASVK